MGKKEPMSGAPASLYVDDRRTHEVRVGLERGRTLDFVIRESLYGGSPAEEQYVERHTLAEPWEERMHTLALENRLARLGQYYKAGAAGWTPVRAAGHGRVVELAPLGLEGVGESLEFHHFNGEGRHAVTLVGVHQPTPRGPRSLLVRLDYQFPETGGGNLQVVHAKLPLVLYKSALASLHLELAELHFTKIPSNARQMADPRTWAALQAALDAILNRVIASAEASVGDALRDGSGRPLDTRSIAAFRDAAKAAQGAASRARSYDIDYEVGPSGTAVEGKRPEVMMDEVPNDIAAALNDPRLAALHGRLLPPGAEKELLAKGERAIGAAMRDLRLHTRADEQHLVSLLEASLLLRHAFAKRVPVDSEVLNRVRHARVYL